MGKQVISTKNIDNHAITDVLKDSLRHLLSGTSINRKYDFNYHGVTTTPTTTETNLKNLEYHVWSDINYPSWSYILGKIKRLEAKYNLDSKNMIKSYRQGDYEVIRVIQREDLEDWLQSYNLYYGY